MDVSLARRYIILAICVSIATAMAQPGGVKREPRMPNPKNTIYRNRRTKCIKLIEDTVELESFELRKDSGELVEVDLGIPTEEEMKDTIETNRTQIRNPSKMRRFLRCITGRKAQSIESVAYGKNEEEVVIATGKETEEEERTLEEAEEEDEEPGEVTEERKEVKEEPFVKTEAKPTGSNVEIGTTRLPKKVKFFVDPYERLILEGPSVVTVRNFPNVEAMHEFYRAEQVTIESSSDEEELEGARARRGKDTKL